MDTLQEEEIVLNLKLLKSYRIYQLFDTNSIKIDKWNVNVILVMCMNVLSLFITTFGTMGFFVKKDNSYGYIDYFLIGFIVIMKYATFIMISTVLIIKKKEIWNLLEVTKINFLTSYECTQNIAILYERRAKTIRFTTLYLILISPVFIQWLIIPWVLNSYLKNETANWRKENILNLPFPVTVHTYNQYFLFFYILEVLISFAITYNEIIIDILLISFYFALTGQYKIIIQSVKNIGLQDKSPAEHYSELKSILDDQRQLSLRHKSFYSIMRPVLLAYISSAYPTVIIITYSLVTVCLTLKSFTIFDMSKLVSTVVFIFFHLFFHCLIFENINNTVNSVNFAIYSCNWTQMDLKFQKLLLMAMRINDANISAIKYSPRKSVNLELFASIVTTSYNIVSVLVNTINKN